MKTILTLLTGLLLFSYCEVNAQNAHFTNSGTIEFEKTVNMFSMLKKQINKDNEAFYQPIYDQYIKNQPQFKKMKSTLNFVDNKTFFVPIEDENATNSFFGNEAMVGQNNTTYTDLNTQSYINQKKVFEETFLVKDSTRKVRWKITDETREIAGYTCRRANAIVIDSVYVVAFYTDRIPVSGGPELFSGLPGMILGVALPHENVTWFATKVTEGVPEPKAMIAPKKGKPVNYQGLKKTLSDATKDWGQYKDAYLKGFSL
jgi:GLPGLI family protein